MYSGYYTASSEDFNSLADDGYLRPGSEFYDKWVTFFNNPKPIKFKFIINNSYNYMILNYAYNPSGALFYATLDKVRILVSYDSLENVISFSTEFESQ